MAAGRSARRTPRHLGIRHGQNIRQRTEHDAAAAGDVHGKSTFDPSSGPRWNGWGVNDNNTRFQEAAMAGLTAADVPRLKLKWAFGFPGDLQSKAQSTIAGGRVFVGSAGASCTR